MNLFDEKQAIKAKTAKTPLILNALNAEYCLHDLLY